MNFADDIQQQCYEKILPWMREIFDEYLIENPKEPEFGVMVGSAFAQTVLEPFEDDNVLVCTRAYVVRQPDLSPSLLDFLLKENFRVLLGGFGIDPSGDIFFQHSILGQTCSMADLESSVMAVALLADQYDDVIVEQWGGQRASDAPAPRPVLF